MHPALIKICQGYENVVGGTTSLTIPLDRKKQQSTLHLAESLDCVMQDQIKLSNLVPSNNPRIILRVKNNDSGCTYELDSVKFLKLVSRMMIGGHVSRVQSITADAHAQQRPYAALVLYL